MPPAPDAKIDTIFVFELSGVRACHFGDFGQGALRDAQARAIGRRPGSSSAPSRSCSALN
jgi:hypothetical protein